MLNENGKVQHQEKRTLLMKPFIGCITPEIESGKAYDMNVLIMMFRKEIEKMGNEADSYTKQKLKERLIAHLSKNLSSISHPNNPNRR